MRRYDNGITAADLNGTANGPVIKYRIEDLPEEKQRWIASLPVFRPSSDSSTTVKQSKPKVGK